MVRNSPSPPSACPFVSMDNRNTYEQSDRERVERALLDIPAVAARLGVSERFVRRLVSERRIAYLKIGHFVRFEAEQVEQWIEASRVLAVPNGGRR